MADGQVLINSKLNTEGVDKGIADLKKDFTKLSGELSRLAAKIEREFNDVDLGDIGRDLGESVEEGAREAAKAASRIADAMEDASEEIAAESDEAADEIKEDFDDISDKAKKSSEEIKGSFDGVFKDVFSANVISNVVSNAFERLGEFAMDAAKESIQAAADIQASNAQFEQTFKDVENTARKSLDSIAKQTGVTASRMQSSYTKIYAFTKSIGGSSTQALDIASRAMIAAADSAAYYDRSLEETTETLQSFLKGNYENDAALGIAATETTRNTMANKLYAKSFMELSESQKVDTLLAMVEAGNEASGALGQAAREADSWTNVMGELQEAWKQFLATLGAPILRELAPMIQSITDKLREMSQIAASAELAEGMREFGDAVNEAEADFQQTTQEIERSAMMADYYKEALERLTREGFEPNSAASREYANAVEQLNSIYPELNLQIDEQTGLLTKNSKAQLANLDSMKKRALFAAQEEKLTAALKAQAAARADIIAAEKELYNLEAELAASLGVTADQLDVAALSVNGLTREQMLLRQEILDLEEGIREGNEAIVAQDGELQELADAAEAASEEFGILTEEQKKAAEAAEAEAAANEELAKKFLEAKETARESIDSQIGLFDKLSTKSDMTAKQIVDNWGDQTVAFANYADNLQRAVEMGLDESLVKQFADGSEQSMLYLNELVNGSGVTVEQINAEFLELNQIRDNVAGVIAGIQEDLAVVPETVGEAVDGMVADAGARSTAGMSEAGSTITTTVLVPLQDSAKTTGETIAEAFETAAKSMKAAWTGMGNWFDTNVVTPIKTGMESLSQTYAQVSAELVEETAASWAQMVEIVNDSINEMQDKINSLEGKTVSVGVTSTGTASEAAYVAEQTPAYTPETLNVPYLARGAVIPPRAPFVAVLGDQPNGMNIEAPLDTIKQAVSEVLGDGFDITTTVNFEGTLAELIRMLYPEIRSEARRRGTNLAQEVIL